MQRLLLMFFLLFNGSYSFATELSDLGEPAMVEILAQTAVVNVTEEGKTLLTLYNVDSQATLVGNLYKQDQRFFGAFPLSDLPPVWNAYNAKRNEHHLWHVDGVNSTFAFNSGPPSKVREPFLATAPLVTAKLNTTRIVGKDEGIARLMLANADFEPANNQLTFEVKDKFIEPGYYQRVRVLTECFLDFLQK